MYTDVYIYIINIDIYILDTYIYAVYIGIWI